MIAASGAKLADTEASQLDRRELAVGSWRQGEIANAEFLLDGVLSEPMTPRVAVQCWVSKAAFRVDVADYEGSLKALESAAKFLDAADLRFQGSFYNQRARVHNRLGNVDAALTDYAGASVCFEAVGDKSYEGAAFLNIAELYIQRGDVARARENIDRALRLIKESNSEYLCQCLDTLAQIELAEGQIEKAIESIRKAFELVGDNQAWLKDVIKTRNKIGEKIEELSGDLHSVNVEAVRRALIKTGGNLTQAGKLTGLTHKGVSYIVDRHQELEPFRVKRRKRTRFTSIIK